MTLKKQLSVGPILSCHDQSAVHPRKVRSRFENVCHRRGHRDLLYSRKGGSATRPHPTRSNATAGTPDLRCMSSERSFRIYLDGNDLSRIFVSDDDRHPFGLAMVRRFARVIVGSMFGVSAHAEAFWIRPNMILATVILATVLVVAKSTTAQDRWQDPPMGSYNSLKAARRRRTGSKSQSPRCDWS